jgi:competence protein ComFC
VSGGPSGLRRMVVEAGCAEVGAFRKKMRPTPLRIHDRQKTEKEVYWIDWRRAGRGPAPLFVSGFGEWWVGFNEIWGGVRGKKRFHDDENCYHLRDYYYIITFMAKIRPTEIKGPWRAGFVLDYQIVSSTFTGYDGFGHPQFDTVRTELGELLYRLKYRADKSVVDEIVDAVEGFVESRRWDPPISLIVPMPASRTRREQPVHILGEALGGRLGIKVVLEAVKKVKSTPQLKDVKDYNERVQLLSGAFTVSTPMIAGQSVLLLDDLYQSGATIESMTRALYDQGNAGAVFALALTRSQR